MKYLLSFGLVLGSFSSALSADPACQTGIAVGSSCCAHSCGKCGGPSCGTFPGGSAECCTGHIQESHVSCNNAEPPCIISPPPVPTECGHYPAPLAKDQPNVLIIGDSISMPVPYTPGGYGVNTRELLENKSINVWHNGGWDGGGQAANTVKGLMCTNTSFQGNWLNISKGDMYDVVHFNFGLHDLVDEGPGEGQEHVNLTDYGRNLQEIYKRLSTIGREVIWTTTTPCPNVTTSMGRTDAKVMAYNAQAKESLSTAAAALNRTLFIDDLYTAVDNFCGKNYKTCSLQKPANVHFEPTGCEFMGKHVAQSIEAVLNNSLV